MIHDADDDEIIDLSKPVDPKRMAFIEGLTMDLFNMPARRPPADSYWCPVMAVSKDEYAELWVGLRPLERWAHQGWVENQGFGALWDFNRGCWVTHT